MTTTACFMVVPPLAVHIMVPAIRGNPASSFRRDAIHGAANISTATLPSTPTIGYGASDPIIGRMS